jgi:hypothetical protein
VQVTKLVGRAELGYDSGGFDGGDSERMFLSEVVLHAVDIGNPTMPRWTLLDCHNVPPLMQRIQTRYAPGTTRSE